MTVDNDKPLYLVSNVELTEELKRRYDRVIMLGERDGVPDNEHPHRLVIKVPSAPDKNDLDVIGFFRMSSLLQTETMVRAIKAILGGNEGW